MPIVTYKNSIEMEFGKLFDDLTFLNTNCIVLNLIIAFPWDTLRLKLRYSDFRLFSVKNALDYSAIIIRRIYYDSKEYAVTIPHLHKRIVNDSTPKMDRARIKEIRYALKQHEESVNHFRHRELAHHFNDPNFKLNKMLRLSMADIREIIDLMNEYLRILRRLYDKGGYYRFTPWARKTGPMGVKRILDSIAKESEVLTYKEKDPDLWSAHVRQLQKENNLEHDLKIINEYRVRLLNLEPIVFDRYTLSAKPG